MAGIGKKVSYTSDGSTSPEITVVRTLLCSKVVGCTGITLHVVCSGGGCVLCGVELVLFASEM
jgi:hypothetical protein